MLHPIGEDFTILGSFVPVSFEVPQNLIFFEARAVRKLSLAYYTRSLSLESSCGLYITTTV